MQRITPFLWFDTGAGKASGFYASIFPKSTVRTATALSGTPSGTVEIISAVFAGQEFTLMSAGPYAKFNPSVSFLVACETDQEINDLWSELSKDGRPLMEIGQYPFSARYGWTEDRYGVSWQLILVDKPPIGQRITPTLTFTGSLSGKAEEAVHFYTSVFESSTLGDVIRYGPGQEPDKEGTVAHATFGLAGHQFVAMDSARMRDMSFDQAISFVVNCQTQDEIDYYWEKLSYQPEAEQCGWLKDKYGLPWQVVPMILQEMIRDKDPQKVARVTEAFMPMKKIDIETLQRAYRGE